MCDGCANSDWWAYTVLSSAYRLSCAEERRQLPEEEQGRCLWQHTAPNNTNWQPFMVVCAAKFLVFFVLTVTHALVLLLGCKMLLLMHWSYVDITWLRYFKYVSFCPFCNFLYVLSTVSHFPILTPQIGSSRNMDFKSPGWQLCCCLRMIVYRRRSPKVSSHPGSTTMSAVP